MSPLTPVSNLHEFDPPPEYLRQGPEQPPPAGERNRWASIVAVTVALVTLTAFAGGVWFAYQEGVQKGIELAPPLVRADPSPTKVVPPDPGGLQVANQDKRVFEAIANAPVPAPRVEQLLPPPETPMTPPTPEPRVAATPPAALPTPEPTIAATLPTGVTDNGVPVPPREALQEPVSPVAAARTVTAPPATPPQTAAAPRPAATAPTAAAAPAGAGFRVQLGAFNDDKIALANWETLKRKHGETLTGLTPTVVAATVNGRSFQRLQAGPLATSAAAAQLCDRLKAGGTDCLVVRP
jgi:hypothetical protein